MHLGSGLEARLLVLASLTGTIVLFFAQSESSGSCSGFEVSVLSFWYSRRRFQFFPDFILWRFFHGRSLDFHVSLSVALAAF